MLLLPVYNGIKSWCFCAQCYLNVMLRIQLISGICFDLKQTGKFCFAQARYVSNGEAQSSPGYYWKIQFGFNNCFSYQSDLP